LLNKDICPPKAGLDKRTGDGFTADCIVSGKILTSLVEIVGEAVNGVNKFYWDSTGLYAVYPDNANRYMKFSKEGLRGYVDGILRLHLGPYAEDKFGLLLRAPDGITTILDEDGILQTWQEGRADNVDAYHPLVLNGLSAGRNDIGTQGYFEVQAAGFQGI